MQDRRIGVSPWWAIALLPVGLVAGWWLGAMPVPALEQAPAPAPVVDVPRAATPTAAPPRVAAPPAGKRPPPAPAAEAPGASAAVVSAWMSMESALAESRRTGKPILIDFSADWCPPCRAMKRQVFDDATLGRAVQTAVIPVVVVDRVREDGRNPADVEALQQRYRVSAFPTLIVFSPANDRVMKTEGFAGTERTVAWIQDAAHAVR